MSVDMDAGPDARYQRCGKLHAGHDANHHSSKPEPVVNMQRQNRQGDPDHQESRRDDSHDWGKHERD
ncbi:MAG: hypothetical protein E5V40_30040 [Mesorhizobium sp.]|nr:MAG: hypothetical protein E5V40_30040 [Mesorhizobium sp.]